MNKEERTKITIDFHSTKVANSHEIKIINSEKLEVYEIFTTLIEVAADFASRDRGISHLDAMKFIGIMTLGYVEDMEQRERARAN